MRDDTMTDEIQPVEEKRRPGRPPRSEATQERRKKRFGNGELTGRRLGVLKSRLDFDSFKYRWINDHEARFHAKTQEDDWSLVPNDGVKEDSVDLGNAVSQIVGTKPDGSALRAYLCRKPKKWFEEDQAEKQAELDEQLTQLLRGNDRHGGTHGDYTPNSGIRITRG
jgi:hypothetical protein